MPQITTKAAPTDTKTALLDAGEKLFARIGIAQSSLRAITREADANLASVNYHFGSKEGLVRAVFARRLDPLNRRRLELLDRCPRRDRGGPDLTCLLRAFVEPAVTMIHSEEVGNREFAKLLGRMLFEPSAELRALMIDEFREVGERFTDQLSRVFPEVEKEEIVWRFHFMVGTLAHTVAARFMISHRLECLHLPEDEDSEAITARLVDFLSTGWQGLGSAREETGNAIQ